MEIKNRNAGIGGTDAAAILGLNPYKTALDVWMEKTGRTEIQELDNKYTYWGKILESIVADEYAKLCKCKIKKVNKTVTHKKYSWMFGHLDRKVIGEKKFLECKTTSAYRKNAWGNEGSDYVPDEYLIQVQHYLAITGYESADLAVLIGGNDFKIYNIVKDDALITTLIERLREFWEKNIQENIPPEPVSVIDATNLWRTNTEEIIIATDEQLSLVNEIRKLSFEISSLEKAKDEKRTELCKAIKNSAVIMDIKGKILATWRESKNGYRVLRVY